jgi:ABC-type hemin transport system ATPase subunit
VVAVLHDLNQASRYCDHLVVLANGRVMARIAGRGDAARVTENGI